MLPRIAATPSLFRPTLNVRSESRTPHCELTSPRIRGSSVRNVQDFDVSKLLDGVGSFSSERSRITVVFGDREVLALPLLCLLAKTFRPFRVDKGLEARLRQHRVACRRLQHFRVRELILILSFFNSAYSPMPNEA